MQSDSIKKLKPCAYCGRLTGNVIWDLATCQNIACCAGCRHKIMRIGK